MHNLYNLNETINKEQKENSKKVNLYAQQRAETAPGNGNAYNSQEYDVTSAITIYVAAIDKVLAILQEMDEGIAAKATASTEDKITLNTKLVQNFQLASQIIDKFCKWFSINPEKPEPLLEYFLPQFQNANRYIHHFFLSEKSDYSEVTRRILLNIRENMLDLR